MTGSAWRARLALVAWLGAVVAVVIGLRLAGHGQLAPPPLSRPAALAAWVGSRDPVVAAIAIVRVIALWLALYVLVTGTAGVLFRVVRAPQLAAMADRVTPALVRRLLVAAASVSVATAGPGTAVFAGAAPVPVAAAAPFGAGTTALVAAAPAPSSSSTSTSSTSSTTMPARTTPTMRLLAPGETPPDVAVPSVAQVPPAAAVGPQPVQTPRQLPSAPPTTWTVKRGECFWSIAEDVLVRAWGRDVSDAELVPYWRVLIDANRATLVDPQNADLIYPGQVFTVPTPPRPPPP